MLVSVTALYSLTNKVVIMKRVNGANVLSVYAPPTAV